MDIDESIVRLAAKLDDWFYGNLATFKSQDVVAQAKAQLEGFEIVKELDRLKADGLSAMTALLDRHDPVTGNERAASLLKGFEFGARLADTLHDELRDMEGETKVVRLMDAIVKELETIGSGRTALTVLLDHPDAGVRALAGVYLIDLKPERVVAILRDIKNKEHANSARFRAFWTLLGWEREGRSRFNYLSAS